VSCSESKPKKLPFLPAEKAIFAEILAMTNDQIGKFLESGHLAKHSVKIDFKSRQSIIGLFLKTNDYDELKSKNFWRIVSETHISQWKSSQDNNLAKIFNGSEITRLTPVAAK
jgi:hypothetical protein